MNIRLALLGVDADGFPTVWIRDERRSFPMALLPNGAGCEPTLPIRGFTELEITELPPRDAELLFCIPLVEPTQDLLKEVAV